ncbi:MarR family winged helix-turn-helix transcriptional regulator [Agromyces sp. Marseille-P2726]|uniref:MarR family winged helix-turn-helix transcriptional regulator n=1 Tax=Agromyces sp. Marseille-P2726 TaxID=2709132 RepID=UPI00157068FF|nr:hypothetical protein [Agromyces sp. Marseille-P2726]
MNTDHIESDRSDRDDENDRTAASAPVDRPLGFWLKLVDRRISHEMQALFAADGIARRDWRLLNLIAGEAHDERLAERLRAKPHVLHRLSERGWISGTPPVLTDAGRAARERLGREVGTLRARVAGAVSADDFATTVRTLEAIARELGWDESEPLPRGRRGGRGRTSGSWHGMREAQGFGRWHGGGRRHGFGPRPGFGPQPRAQDVHVHVHLHDREHHGERGGRRYSGA